MRARSHRRMLPILLSAAVLGLIALAVVRIAPWRSEGLPDPIVLPDGSRGLGGHIVSVTDGDTVVVDFGPAGIERVRLLGIDTPETVKPNSPVECWGPEASARTEELLPPGTPILGQRDIEARDRYGRLLLYLWRTNDGLFINRVLLEEGHAEPLSIAPNHGRRAELSAASARARTANRGLWGRCPPTGDR